MQHRGYHNNIHFSAGTPPVYLMGPVYPSQPYPYQPFPNQPHPNQPYQPYLHHWQTPQGYNNAFSSSPRYRMGPSQQHSNQQYQSQAPKRYNTQFSAGPDYPMGRQHPNQHHHAPRSGPQRNRRSRYRKTEPHSNNHINHKSSGSVVNDRSTGIDPGMARIGARNETRDGKVCKTPSENLLMADCNLT